jgi:hypothetical protein
MAVNAPARRVVTLDGLLYIVIASRARMTEAAWSSGSGSLKRGVVVVVPTDVEALSS